MSGNPCTKSHDGENPNLSSMWQTIVINAFHCEVFEGMHWVCLHLEYEHLNHDADEPCDDPSCFWKRSASPKAGSWIK
jgi:hypothetical protein